MYSYVIITWAYFKNEQGVVIGYIINSWFPSSLHRQDIRIGKLRSFPMSILKQKTVDLSILLHHRQGTTQPERGL
jgi:hypothetical protein